MGERLLSHAHSTMRYRAHGGSKTMPCGTNRHTVALGDAVISSLPGRYGRYHLYRLIGQCGDRGLDQVGIGLFSDDVVTRTRGLSIEANQWGIEFGSGSNTQGPIICTASPQSVCGY